ncbi:hypothetical protein F4779DRAFT_188425 [Xylariaceae sp. FL0662B]|nr:hypothetical protein F4779DRAFT_188425 [Xylariaceae sp. FL0662B]
MPLVSRAQSQPAPTYRAGRVAFENPIYDDEWSSDSEWDTRPNGRWSGAPVVDGLGARDLNRMEGRLRDRQTATSRKTAPDNYNLHNERTSRRPTVDRDGYPSYTAPSSANYETMGHPAPYGYPDYFTDPYTTTRPAAANHAPPFMPASYPNPQGSYPMNNQNPFVRKPPQGPQHGMPPRRRPPMDTEMNRMREELEDLRLPRGVEQADEYWQEDEDEETEGIHAEEHRVKRKRSEGLRQKEARRKEQEDMRREIERQVNAKLERHLRGVSSGSRSDPSAGPDVDNLLRNLLGRMSTGGAGGPEGRHAQQERRGGEYDQILDLVQGRRQLHGNSTLVRLLADHVTSSAAGDLILRRLDDLIYQQRRVEDAVGGLLGQARDPSMNGRAAVSGRPPSAPVPQYSDMERDYEAHVGPSNRPPQNGELRPSRQALRRLSNGEGLRSPSYTEAEDVLSKRSTDATLEALRRRSRPASPVESDDDLEFDYEDIQRKTPPARRARLRQRAGRRKSIERRDAFPSEDSADDYDPPAPQLATRRSFHGRPEGVDNIPLTDNVEVKIRRSRLGKKSKELRKRDHPDEGPVDRRRKSKARPVVTRHRTPPAYLDEEAADVSEDSWDNNNTFHGQPRPYYYDPSSSSRSDWHAGGSRGRRRPQAPTPPPAARYI